MRRKQAGRITAWLLAAALLCGQAPLTAFAENGTGPDGRQSVPRQEEDSGQEPGLQDAVTVSDGNEDASGGSGGNADGGGGSVNQPTQNPSTVSGGNPGDFVLNSEEGIPDKALYDALLAVGDSNGDRALTKSEAKSISGLSLNEFKGHLDHLSMYAPNLTNISIWNNYSEVLHEFDQDDLLELTQLPMLTNLGITNVKLGDAAKLGNLHSLCNLSLNHCGITNIDFITKENFPLLGWLELGNNPIYVMPQAIGELPKLTYLHMGYCELRKLADLTGVTQLDTLFLNGNKLTREELLQNAPAKFANDESWLTQTIDPNYDPSMDEYYPENQRIITNDEKGIPDSGLYAALLFQGDQNNGNRDGMLSVAEARRISFLACSGQIKQYTNLAKYAPNIMNIYADHIGEAAWNTAEASFLEQYALLEKVGTVNITLYNGELLDKICEKRNLTSLNLSCMKETDFTALSNLPLLDLTVSRLQYNSGIEAVINTLGKLTSLDVSGSGFDLNLLSDGLKANLMYCRVNLSGDNETVYDMDFSALRSARTINVMANISAVSGLDKTQVSSLTLMNNASNKINLGNLPEGLLYLSLMGFDVKDLKTSSNIASLQKLYALTIENCGLANIDGISALPQLSSLNLQANEISDVSELASLKNVVSLNLQGNQITDVTGLEQMTKLVSLNLSYNRLQALPDLTGLNGLSGDYITGYSTSLNLIGNLLTKDKIIGYVPSMFSDNSLWLLKAASRSFQSQLYYTDLDSKDIAALVFEYGAPAYSSINLTKDSQASCSAELFQLLKDKGVSVAFNFKDCETGNNVMTYHFRKDSVYPELDHDLVLKYVEQPEQIEGKEAAESYFAEYGKIPVYYFQNNIPEELSWLCFEYMVPSMQAEGTSTYNYYFYDYKTKDITKVRNGYYNYQGNYFSNFEANKASAPNPDLNKTAAEGFYFWAQSKYTITNNNTGEFSEPGHYNGDYCNYGELGKVLKEKVTAAPEGGTVRIACLYSPNIEIDLWNQAVDKKLNWEFIQLDDKECVQSVLKINGEDTIKIKGSGIIGWSTHVNKTMLPDPLLGYINGALTTRVSWFGMCNKAEVSVYVGSYYKNGEELNLYYYTTPVTTNTGNNSVPDSDMGYRIHETGTEPMTVSYGMITFTYGDQKSSNMFLVNSKLDLEKEPENPLPGEPDDPGTDEPENPGQPDKPGTEEPGNPGADEDGKQPPAVIEEDKIVEAGKALDVIAEKMDKLDPNIEVYTKEPVTLDKDIFQNMAKENKNVSVSVVNENNQMMYGWTFRHSDISQSKLAEFEKLNLGISFATEKQKEIEEITHVKDSVYLSFAHHGELPAPATIQTYVGDKYADGEIVHLYYYNEETGKVEAINGSSGLTVKGGYVTYTITHCSVYFLSAATPEQLGLASGSGGSNDSGDDSDGDAGSGSGVAAALAAPAAVKSPKTGEDYSMLYLCMVILCMGLASSIAFYCRAWNKKR